MHIDDGNVERKSAAIYSLHHGRSRAARVRVVADVRSRLYRIAWPDIGLSAPANLARCRDAAREWAEHEFLINHRKMGGARRLKSLDNFWWSSSPIASNATADQFLAEAAE